MVAHRRSVFTRALLFALLLVAVAACPRAEAQQLPRIQFSVPAEIVLLGSISGNLVVTYCARSEDRPGSIFVYELTAPEVDHERRTLTCPGGLDTIVSTQAPGQPCAFSREVLAVMSLARPERLRVMVCRDMRMAILLRRPMHKAPNVTDL